MAVRMLNEMPARYPTNGTFELTVRCNLQCKMCLFRHHEREYGRLKKEELTAEQWISLGQQAADAGTLHLLITGGEPMIRTDFCDIWKGLYRQGFLLQLYTNATMITPEIMDVLRRFPPHKIGVTLYGVSEDTYQKVCGNGAAFSRMVRGIHQLMKLPSLVEIRTTIIKDNLPDLDQMEEFLKKEFHYQGRLVHSDLVIKPVRGGCAETAECRLEPELQADLGLHRITSSINRFFEKKEIPIPEYRLGIHQHRQEKEKERITLFGCEAGMDSYTISWNGALLGCQLMEDTGINCLDEGFAPAWEKYPFSVITEKTVCHACGLREKCPACYAVRNAETESTDICSEYCRRFAIQRNSH